MLDPEFAALDGQVANESSEQERSANRGASRRTSAREAHPVSVALHRRGADKDPRYADGLPRLPVLDRGRGWQAGSVRFSAPPADRNERGQSRRGRDARLSSDDY